MSVNSDWNKQGGKVAPEEWVTRLAGITDRRVMVKTASIIWWDFFSAREYKKRWPHLDNLMTEWEAEKDAPSDLLVQGLMQVGYPEEVAVQRASNIQASDTIPLHADVA